MSTLSARTIPLPRFVPRLLALPALLLLGYLVRTTAPSPGKVA
ncbi:hypothetical protein SAMN05443665_102495 [Actinomadura meyerae]|uniref:Uncharacterized protein n=1 Tax=Actinomadura meyerae TaxID=240840 RepID=A0A239LXQ8_9ACTN|nr:hypothetical protein [Actinomadura meyerae]SNT34489.1 hypothetical protein SAMN05443665_102495 [Actinomadura meyerae]